MYSNGTHSISYPGQYATYHRADLQKILLSHVSSFVQCHLNHRLVNYTEMEEGIELEFKNGETASCDIFVDECGSCLEWDVGL
jgi:salicylate hydroxylase